MKQTVPVRRSLRTGRLSSKSAMTTKWDSGNLCGQLPHRREGPARNTVRASTGGVEYGADSDHARFVAQHILCLHMQVEGPIS